MARSATALRGGFVSASRGTALGLLTLFCLCGRGGDLFAQAPSTLHIGSSADFINAVATINSNTNTNYTIVFDQNVTLTGQALPIMTNATLTFDGNSRTIDGGGAYRPFFIESGTVELKNMTIVNAQAHGGNGGGGGLGAGAAVFVDSSGHLSLRNVQFSNNAAIGGNGSNNWGQGGGGLGGNGGSGPSSGGGGLYGNGGSTVSLPTGGGGGGGALGNGGQGSATSFSPFSVGQGGGGGGMSANGADATTSTPGAGGGSEGGSGGAAPLPGGGGGGGSDGGYGGDGNLFGGGGGSDDGSNTGPRGGAGGRFGGGGGGLGGSFGGHGGFGGGGGNGVNQPGNGGFGGGGGANYVGTGGTGGFGGGNGESGNNNRFATGGGGAAFGGALFVADGGSITILNSVGFTNNTVTGGTGYQNGSADGADLFLMRGVSTTFDIAGGQSLTFAPTLGNNDGSANPDVTLNKTGAGTLILTGTSPLGGVATVDAGRLAVNGAYGGQINVNNGGTLGGGGTVGNVNVNSGGILAPGNSIGTITVSGNLTQSAGSTYVAEVSTTGADKIIVTGTAAIQNGATFQAVAAPGAYHVGQTFTVLTATGGITGTYTSSILPSLSGGLAFRLDYDDPHEIDLYVTRAFRFVDLAGTPSQNAVAGVLDNLYDTSTGDLATLLSQLQGVDPGQLPALFDQFSGNFNATPTQIDLQNANVWLQILSSRFAGPIGGTSPNGNSFADLEAATYEADVQLVSYQQADGQTASVPYLLVRRRQANVGWTGWTQGYGAAGNVVGGGAGGIGYGLGGTLSGADRALSDNLAVGLFGGYAGSSINDKAGTAGGRINAYQFGFYQRFLAGGFYVTNLDAYANSSYDVRRAVPLVGTATGKSIGNQYAHYTEAGLTLGRGPIQLQPFTGLQYVYLNQNGYTESGAGALGLVVGPQTVTSLRSNIGLRLFTELNRGRVKLTPSAAARYQREFGDGTQLVSSSFVGAPTASFITPGNPLGRDFGLFTLGLNATFGNRTSLYASCDAQVADRYTAILGTGGLQFTW